MRSEVISKAIGDLIPVYSVIQWALFSPLPLYL